jgi:hypothetical protein
MVMGVWGVLASRIGINTPSQTDKLARLASVRAQDLLMSTTLGASKWSDVAYPQGEASLRFRSARCRLRQPTEASKKLLPLLLPAAGPGFPQSSRKAPISRTNVSATSAITSTPPGRPRRRLTDDAVTAGANPNRSPDITAMPPVTSTTRISMPIFWSRGTCSGADGYEAGTPHQAKSRPTAPCDIARVMHPVSIGRTSRMLLAPSAVRIAISRCRTVARAGRRLATFTHGISSTNSNAPHRMSSVGRAWQTRSFWNGLS